MPCQCRAKLRIVGERVETRREGRKARQSPDHEPETGGESRSGTHNPLVVGSSPTRPTTLYCRVASALGAHASVALARHGVPAHRRAFHFAARGGAGFLCIRLSSRAFCRPILPGFHLSVRGPSPCRTIPLETLKCFRGPFGRSMAWSGSLSGNHGSSPCVSGILRFDILSTHCRMLR